MFRKEKGFTLIELLIVIAVIGILAAAILPRFISFDIDAKISSTKGSLSSLRTASVMRRSKVESYVDTIGGLAPTYIAKVPVAQWPTVTSYNTEYASVGDISGTTGGWALVTAGAGEGEIYVNVTGYCSDDSSYYTDW